jgi:hypothetical protein
VYDAPFLKVAACGEFWLVRSTMVPEAVVDGVIVGVPERGPFPGFPIHADARIYATIKERQTGIHTFFMHVRKENRYLNYFGTFQILE